METHAEAVSSEILPDKINLAIGYSLKISRIINKFNGNINKFNGNINKFNGNLNKYQ